MKFKVMLFTQWGKNYSVRDLCQTCLYFHGQKDLFWFLFSGYHFTAYLQQCTNDLCEWWNKHFNFTFGCCKEMGGDTEGQQLCLFSYSDPREALVTQNVEPVPWFHSVPWKTGSVSSSATSGRGALRKMAAVCFWRLGWSEQHHPFVLRSLFLSYHQGQAFYWTQMH